MITICVEGDVDASVVLNWWAHGSSLLALGFLAPQGLRVTCGSLAGRFCSMQRYGPGGSLLPTGAPEKGKYGLARGVGRLVCISLRRWSVQLETRGWERWAHPYAQPGRLLALCRFRRAVKSSPTMASINLVRTLTGQWDP